MSNIVENIFGIKEKIDRINPSCEIVAATKTRSIEEIREAVNTGLLAAAGENKAQELCDKYAEDVRWDFIGRLQTNKVKYIVDKVRLIHSMDRLALAEQVEKESAKRNMISDVLIEINTAAEENKGGILLEETEDFLEKLSVFPHIRVCGMMAVTENGSDAGFLRKTFDEVFKVFDGLKGGAFKYLSMGMSNDYEIALESGANIIRPGRVIFGERNYGTERSEGGYAGKF